MKKLALVLALSMLLSLYACGNEEAKSEETPSESASLSEETAENEKEEEIKLPPKAKEATENWEDGYLPQANEPSADSVFATLHTTMGDVKMVLYPEAAPLTVENFVTHALEGYYNNISFHRVIKDFMIQGGDPMGNGMGGESIWGVPFRDEPNRHLYNFRGAVSMANAGPSTNGSQFFIVQCDKEHTTLTDDMKEQYMSTVYYNEILAGLYSKVIDYKIEENPDDETLKAKIAELEEEANNLLKEGLKEDASIDAAFKHYQEVGGTPHLDFKHTVFGQVVEGMDIVDKIAQVETGENDMPKEPVVIKSIDIENAPSYN